MEDNSNGKPHQVTFDDSAATTPSEWSSSSEEEVDTETAEEKARRRIRFRKLRAHHYQMKESLKEGRQLIQSDVDDDLDHHYCSVDN